MLLIFWTASVLTSCVAATSFNTFDVYRDASTGVLHRVSRSHTTKPYFENVMCLAPKGVFMDRTRPHAPWTSPPQCVRGAHWETRAPQTFCIFVKKDFAEGRGIAILASPKVAARIAATEAFTKPESIYGANDASQEPFRKVLFPKKGYGLVANRTIFRGERIMQETSAWIYDRDAFTSLPEEVRIPLTWNMAYQLPEGARSDLLALHGHYGEDELDDIMRTNAFGAYFSKQPNRIYNQVFPRISRFNHDCRPNAHYYFDKATMTQYVNAIRKIEKDEEILVSYTDGEMFSHERKAAIMDSWGFECDCSICRQHPEALAASDRRLAVIKDLKTFLEDWSEVRKDRPQKAELLASLYELERMEVSAATAYEAAAYAYNVFGNEWKAMEYAAKAHEAMTLYYGASNPITVEMERLMVDPKGHQTWNYALPAGQAQVGSAKEDEGTAPKTKKGWF